MNQSFFEESRMKIRYAEVFDAFSLAKIHSDTWQTAYANLIPQKILEKRAFSQERVLRWENRLKNKNHIVLLAENDEGIVTGFAWGGIGTDERISRQFELYALYVDEKEQKHGFGSALLKAFACEIKADFYLFALKNNEKAKKFYISKGGILKPEFAKRQEDSGFILEEDCFFFNADIF